MTDDQRPVAPFTFAKMEPGEKLLSYRHDVEAQEVVIEILRLDGTVTEERSKWSDFGSQQSGPVRQERKHDKRMG